MLVYILFSVILLFGYFNKKMSSKFMLTLLIIFLGIRFMTGWDYSWYYEEIENIAIVGHLNREDLSQFWINLFLLGKYIGVFWLPISLVGVITISLIYGSLKLIFKNNDQYIKSALLFFAFYPEFYLATFSTIRQWIAIALCLFMFCLFINRNKNKLAFLMLFLCTVSFSIVYLHSSSFVTLVYIPIFYISKKVKSRITIIIYVSFSIILCNAITFITNSYLPQYSYYIENMQSGEGQYLYAFYLLLFIISLFNTKYLFKEDIIRLYFILYLISVILSGFTLFVFNSGVISRVSLYLMISILFILPFIIHNNQKRILLTMPIFSIVMACLFLLFLQRISSVKGYKSSYIPYKTIFIAPK